MVFEAERSGTNHMNQILDHVLLCFLIQRAGTCMIFTMYFTHCTILFQLIGPGSLQQLDWI